MFDDLPYKIDSSSLLNFGPYEIKQQDKNTWVLINGDQRDYFSTRMGAIGFARAQLRDKPYTALQIKSLDIEAGASRNHAQSLSNAISNQQDPVIAKKQEADTKHRTNMQALASMVLNILD